MLNTPLSDVIQNIQDGPCGAGARQCDSEAFLSLLRSSGEPQPQLTVYHFAGSSKWSIQLVTPGFLTHRNGHRQYVSFATFRYINLPVCQFGTLFPSYWRRWGSWGS